MADATGPAVNEILVMLGDVAGEQPLTEDELEYARSGILNSFAGRYETVDYLLNQERDIWRYGLPGDWTTQFPAQVEAVTPEAAQQAFQSHVAEANAMIVVVGDMATQREALEALGPKVIELDVNGYTLPEVEESN